MSVRRRPHVRRVGLDWEEQPLGEKPDREIAKRLGCTPSAVYFARQTRNVPPFKKPSGLSVGEVEAIVGRIFTGTTLAPLFGSSARARRWLNTAARRGLLIAVGSTRNRHFVVAPDEEPSE